MRVTKSDSVNNNSRVHKMLGFIFGISILIGVNFFAAFSQNTADKIYSKDVQTLDGIIKAYYEVVSGPAGSIPDKERDLFIHIPDAQVIMMSDDGKGSVKANRMTIVEYHERNSKPRTTGFFEYEIKRETLQYGALTHIWSTYEWKATKDGPVGGRGINSIQLYHDGNRWWIASEIYDIRNKPVPDQYMP